jgi:hypothetical protein
MVLSTIKNVKVEFLGQSQCLTRQSQHLTTQIQILTGQIQGLTGQIQNIVHGQSQRKS